MKKRIIAAVLSAFIYGFYMAVRSYTPEPERLFYLPPWSSIAFYMMYLIPVYVLVGVLLSFLIDKWTKRTITRFFIYIVAGIIVSILAGHVMFGVFNGPVHPLTVIQIYSRLGAMGALIFILSLGLTQYVMRKIGR